MAAKIDDTAPATKGDIAMMKSDIAVMKDGITAMMGEIGKLYDANERWKDELKDHFDLALENDRHDLKSANREEIGVLKDRSNDHGTRITRLETHAGLAA